MTSSDFTPTVGTEQIALLERLSNASGVSGAENEVRAIVLEQVRPLLQDRPGEIKTDSLGNVLVLLTAADAPPPGEEARRLRVMVAAHMDEVGLMISASEDKGFYRFETVGGIDTRVLAGKPVLVGRDHTPGVIGAKAIHLTRREERKRAFTSEDLRIDVGPEATCKVGDRAAFATRFRQIGPSLVGKALDNRLGVATLIELIRHAPPNIDLLVAFTVQEEIGLRGAGVAAYALEPDLAIAVDSTPAHDQPDWEIEDGRPLESTNYNTRLDAGPAIYLADSGTLSDPRLGRFLIETAEARSLPYQIRQPGGGRTDASAIHMQRAGIPSISVSVPSRYPHTPVMLARLSDWQNTLALLYHALSTMPAGLLQGERQ